MVGNPTQQSNEAPLERSAEILVSKPDSSVTGKRVGQNVGQLGWYRE